MDRLFASASARHLWLALVVVSAAALSACADFSAALDEPNSRVMTLTALDRAIKPGMTQRDVLTQIGRPAYTFPVGWQRLTVWNYRFARPEGDCVVWQISFRNETGLVHETGQGPDEACNAPNRS